ncbi:conserved hypothetical protein [Theileria orientalis strain Shintoku]|uniref:Uncharacterized protein n=1 Tax=Theileria orientalis strain Shintoku TaxID=869250 RepID=J7MC78_THEOR|nr:conserved hypothetical protein [Theileria orientalis strain Shintoku]PVC50936.1 hypothetical protein MACL_00001911 [Theileria orientalis]BAM42337.1 conserved hypothetical protein [Theileria orientalis strain Shintoku]|eukprot:XP_009692638.1 conserved hypothetical protein [Theileria orientalis strain Shintoku]
MSSYLSGKKDTCGNRLRIPFPKLTPNAEEGSEIEFEGWLHLGEPIQERDFHINRRCQRPCSTGNICSHSCKKDDNLFHNQGYTNVEVASNCRHGPNHVCTHNSETVNVVNRKGTCANCVSGNNTHGAGFRQNDQVYYVTNKPNPPTVVVQKPHTVVVRNRSTPPIVVRQPAPNVIVKNERPQPIYVQNCPPNVIVSNPQDSPPRNSPCMSNVQNAQHFARFNGPAFGRQPACGIGRTQHNPGASCRNHKSHNCNNSNYVNF